ncbi:MAG: TonB-dependent receptor [Ginsengibacter sp.]
MKINLKLLLAICLIPFAGFAQQSDTITQPRPDSIAIVKIFQLGEITIAGKKSNEMTTRISATDMESANKMDVSNALNMISGISLTASGPRNESMVTVRGFDLRQVPVYMDGIPVYVPFDGYVDLARFTTFDLSAIDVSKGFSSVLYGPNSLGGAINLISRKPTEKIEYDGSVGMININGYKGNLNIGSNLGKFFIQAGYSLLHRDAYRMSDHFIPTKYENGKERDNSYRTDQKYSLKIGWTPNEKNEYVLGYINQQGKKGNPVYTGHDSLNSLLKKPRFWKWPQWNKETYYFISKTNFNSKNYIKTRFYYDLFKNSINSYDDNTYSTMTKPSAFKSWYNDYTYGGSIEYGTTAIKKNNLKFAAHFKKDVHRENDLNQPVLHFIDNTITLGIEDIYKVTDKLVIIPGISYSTRNNLEAQNYNSSTGIISPFANAKTSKAYNGQVGLFYYVKDGHKIGGSFSHKTRFATIKDRYSYKLGTAIPNPDLKPETADNYEVNYTGNCFKKVSFKTALFYSKITDIIMSINNVEPGRAQMQNAGNAEYVGAEAGLDYNILNNMLFSVNYTYIKRHNLTNPKVYFTDVPNTKVFGYIQYHPIKKLRIMASMEYNSSRFSTSYGTRAGGFTLFNTIVSGKVSKNMNLEGGVNNIFDKNYSLVEGFPEEGRNFFVTLRFFNHR